MGEGRAEDAHFFCSSATCLISLPLLNFSSLPSRPCPPSASIRPTSSCVRRRSRSIARRTERSRLKEEEEAAAASSSY
eukprot:3764640-Prymnesium_polylepis.1